VRMLWRESGGMVGAVERRPCAKVRKSISRCSKYAISGSRISEIADAAFKRRHRVPRWFGVASSVE